MARARRGFPPSPLTIISRPVSRVLYGGLSPTWRPFLWDVAYAAPRAANPDDWSEDRTGQDVAWSCPRRPYSALLPVGFALPLPLPEARCALAAPFHPYPGAKPRRYVFCGTFPEADPRLRGDMPRRTLSGTVSPWSPDFPLRSRAAAARPTDPLEMRRRARRVKGARVNAR
jgi:hypothetical protein